MVNANFNRNGNCNVNWNLNPDNVNDNLGVLVPAMITNSNKLKVRESNFCPRV